MSVSVTATQLHRIMNCNGSLMMPESSSSIEQDKTYRFEGDAAHWLIQQVHSGKVHPSELVDRQAPNGVFITGDMVEHVENYLQDISGFGHVEHDTSYHSGDGKWNVQGRADFVSLANNEITVRDFKYGWSIVEPEKNWTLISHAIGFVIYLNKTIDFDLERMCDKIRLQIFQPRPYHPLGKFREWVITPQDLMVYYKLIGAVLSKPESVLNTGEHCKGCPSTVHCPAFNAAKSNSLEASCLTYSDVISNKELSKQLDELSRASEIIDQALKAYEELALHRLREGAVIDNYVAQTSTTNRAWKDHVTAELLQMLTGHDLTKKDLITPAQAEKKGVPSEIVDSLTERHNKGFKLVRIEADKLANKLFRKG